MNPPTSRLPAITAALVVLALAGFFGWRYFSTTEQAPTPTDVPAAMAPADTPPPAAPPAPAIQHPVEPPTAEADAVPLPALAESDAQVGEALTDLFTRQNVLTFLQLDGFVRRAVATVDNLPRTQAPVMVWPVKPTPQRFTTLLGEGGAVETIHPDNSRRYTPLVLMIESVDTAKAVALYRRLYPLFQQAYEELGFPGSYFNDRLVQVLDHLIATPVPPGPLAVTLVEVKGGVPSTRPWTRYEFSDPALESMSAGRKLLVRTGAENQRRLQARLIDVRERIARR
jgi:hypothetical protein